MSTSTSVSVVLVDDPMQKETMAVAGFLAGYGRYRWQRRPPIEELCDGASEERRQP